MEKDIRTSYAIPDFETGHPIDVSKEEYEKFMETWESVKPKFDEKFENIPHNKNLPAYAEPGSLTYIPMPGIDFDLLSEDLKKSTQELFFIDLNKPEEGLKNG